MPQRSTVTKCTFNACAACEGEAMMTNLMVFALFALSATAFWLIIELWRDGNE